MTLNFDYGLGDELVETDVFTETRAKTSPPLAWTELKLTIRAGAAAAAFAITSVLTSVIGSTSIGAAVPIVAATAAFGAPTMSLRLQLQARAANRLLGAPIVEPVVADPDYGF